jgi:hypothetical protein
MNQMKSTGLVLSASFVVALLVTACSTPTATPTSLAAADSLQCKAAEAPETVALAATFYEDASAWRSYMASVAAIDAKDLKDGKAVAASLRVGATFEPKQLLRGAIAYAAIIGLQDQAFLDGARGFANGPAQRQTLIAELKANPYRVTNMPGAERAAAAIMAALGEEGDKVLKAGTAVKQSAYDVQKQPWSKEFVPDREARLAAVRVLSTTAIKGNMEDVTLLQEASLTPTSTPATLQTANFNGPVTWSPVVVRGLALAALAALGEAGEENTEQVASLLTDEPSMFCLKMSKLMLYQCLAAAKPHYEDMFCIGQHELMDIGECTLKSVGIPKAVKAAPKVEIAESETATGASASKASGSPK